MSYQEYKISCRENVINTLKKSGTFIVQYLRNKKKHPIGVVIAYLRDGTPYIGWSLCHANEPHGWNRYVGLYKALQHAEKLTDLKIVVSGCYYNTLLSLHSVPPSLWKTVDAVCNRAYKKWNCTPPVNMEGEIVNLNEKECVHQILETA